MTALDRLSPSKIAAFRSCPQRFAFRYVQGLEEPADARMIRGTLVHLVCERLFDLPVTQRTPIAAISLLDRLWEQMVADAPELSDLFADAREAGAWIRSAERLVRTWFTVEAPAAIMVEARELFVELSAAQGPVLAGIIDRLDRRPDGSWAITDYKTGLAPGPGWELRAFFQLRFYAMIAVESLGVPVTLLRLVHLAGDGMVLELPFDAADVSPVRRQVAALATAMHRSLQAGSWHASVGARCDWCAFRDRCPAWVS